MDHIICHFEIPADDTTALASFYTELFGWEIRPMGGFDGYWGVNPVPGGGEEVLKGGMMARQHPQQTIMNYVLVEDVDAYSAKAKELGAQVLMGKTEIPGMGWFAVIMDPQKNVLGMFQPV
jgi:uncharacterized protein